MHTRLRRPLILGQACNRSALRPSVKQHSKNRKNRGPCFGTTKKRAKEERIKERRKRKRKRKRERDQSTSIGKLTLQIGTSSFSLATISSSNLIDVDSGLQKSFRPRLFDHFQNELLCRTFCRFCEGHHQIRRPFEKRTRPTSINTHLCLALFFLKGLASTFGCESSALFFAGAMKIGNAQVKIPKNSDPKTLFSLDPCSSAENEAA